MSHALCLVALTDAEIAEHGSLQAAVDFQMLPFDENGTCFKKGSRWDWYQIGGRFSGRLLGDNDRRRRDLTEDALRADQRDRAIKIWAEFTAELKKSPKMARALYDMSEDETEASLVAKMESRTLSAYAFLRDRRWHEGERMGWFGGTARTECEMDQGEDYKGKCLHTDKKTGARIVTWAEEYDVWASRFYKRFVREMDPDAHLIVVDYHV